MGSILSRDSVKLLNWALNFKVNRLDLLLPGIRAIVEYYGKKLIESPERLIIDCGHTKRELDVEHIMFLANEDRYHDLTLYIKGNC